MTTRRAEPVRMIGGPLDGQTLLTTGGIMVEVPNPDKNVWGQWENLAYSFDYEGEELVARFYVQPPKADHLSRQTIAALSAFRLHVATDAESFPIPDRWESRAYKILTAIDGLMAEYFEAVDA